MNSFGPSTTATSSLPRLSAKAVSFHYRQRPVLNHVSLHLAPGDVLSLLGCNGAGKSTLLKLLLGLLRPDTGDLRLNGQPLGCYSQRELAQYIAYVPQQHQPPFPYSVNEIVLMGRLPHGHLFSQTTDADRVMVARTLSRLRISHLAERPYTELSGGERQLVLIARALAQEARFLILDEPVNGLDYGHQYRLLTLLKSLATEGLGILMTTHHPDHALFASTRVVLLEQGQVLAEGTPADVITPAHLARLYDIEVERRELASGELVLLPAQAR